MKKPFDSELSRIFQQKLKNFEVDVPDESEEFVFDAIRPESKVGFSKKIVIVLILITSIPAWYFFRENGGEAVQPKKKIETIGQGNSVDNAPVSSKCLPQSRQYQKRIARLTDYLLKAKSGLGDDHSGSGTGITTPEAVNSNDALRNLGQTKITSDRKLASFKIEEDSNLNLNIPTSVQYTASGDSSSPRELNMTKMNAKDNKADSVEAEKPKTVSKSWMVFSIEPFLNYKVISPLQDGNYLSQFATPSSTNVNRLGYQLTAAVEYRATPRKILLVGVSWFSYASSLSYRAAETGNGIQTFNQISDRVNGFGLQIGTKYKLKSHDARSRYLCLGLDGLCNIDGVSTTTTMLMLTAGYSKHWLIGKHELRATPKFSYGLTEIHYPGVLARPYWVGLEMSYAIMIR